LLNQFGHPDVPLRDWNAFRAGFSPFYLDEVINRDEVHLPEWFMPLARGVATPSDALLRRVGHWDVRGWFETDPGVFRLYLGGYYLQVRQCGNQNLWAVEKLDNGPRPSVDEVLVFCSGGTPIFTRTPTPAMQLAMHCNFSRPPYALRWIKSPDDFEGFDDLVILARARSLDERGAVSEHRYDKS